MRDPVSKTKIKSGMVVYACNLGAEEAEAIGSLEFTGQPAFFFKKGLYNFFFFVITKVCLEVSERCTLSGKSYELTRLNYLGGHGTGERSR